MRLEALGDAWLGPAIRVDDPTLPVAAPSRSVYISCAFR
jgi:hypothetical protein